MKRLLLDYATYHMWANEQLYKTVQKLDDERWNRTVASSFPSLLKTVLHMWDAEAIWWQRIQNKHPLQIPSKSFEEPPIKGMEAMMQQAGLWRDWLASKNEEDLSGSFSYTNLKGQPFTSEYVQLLMHLFNHGTYHRGQVVTILRQLNVEAIPPTDFIVWCRTVSG